MFNTDDFEVLNNAIDTDLYTYNKEKADKVKKEFGIENKFVVGHVGRFNYQKNHPYLIAVFEQVCKLREDAVLLLLGDGPDKEAIEKQCESLGIADKVRFLGNQREPQKYYQAFDVFLLPSFFEGLPGVLVEAQAAGLKCFVSDTITREAKATDLVNYLSIGQAP